MRNKDTNSLFVLLLILFFCLSGANIALGEEGNSVFHYAKPDWWSEALWPNGLKYRNWEARSVKQEVELRDEEPPPFYTDEDDEPNELAIRPTDKSPIVFTFPESKFGQLGTLLFFGQSFLDYNPPTKFKSLGLEDNEDENSSVFRKPLLTAEDISKCQALPTYLGHCDLVGDLNINATYFAGYSLGFSPFASDTGSSRFLKLSLGAGLAYVDIGMDLSICTERGMSSGDDGDDTEDVWCTDKTKVDSTNINGFLLMTVFTFTLYEYVGETFAFSIASYKEGKVSSRTDFKNHDNINITSRLRSLDSFTISVFF
jgi:hypothetical protein